MDTKAVFNPNRKLVTKMFMLEVKVTDPDGSGECIWETWKFANTERLLDYVYIQEGGNIPAEYRNEYQLRAPDLGTIEGLKDSAGFFLWEIENLTFVLSYINPLNRKRREKQCFPQPSKWFEKNKSYGLIRDEG